MGKQIGNMLLEFFNTPNDRYGRAYRIISYTNYIYAPYIPINHVSVVIENEDFTPRLGLLSRYSAVTINENFYGRIQI